MEQEKLASKEAISLIREEHGPLIEMLLDGRISKKEISIHTWAEVTSKKKDMSFDVAYSAAKRAARSLASHGFGRYVEGRRGHVSRFKANSDIKETAKAILGAKGKAEATKQSAKEILSENVGLTAEDIAALKQMLSSRVPEKPSLADFSMDELLAEIGRRTSDRKE